MLAERLREMRTSHGMSRQMVADRLGVSATAVYKWENGQTEPDLTKLRQLALIFGTTIDELCGNTPAEVPDDDDATVVNISVMSRAFRQMSREEQEKYLAIGRVLFAHAFHPEDAE